MKKLVISCEHGTVEEVVLSEEEIAQLPNAKALEKQELERKIAEAKEYIASTDWVEPYILRHELGLQPLASDSNKLIIKANRDEKIEFIRANDVPNP